MLTVPGNKAESNPDHDDDQEGRPKDDDQLLIQR